MTTKEKIIWEALELFSRKTYGAVSVRDIARAVGIRESSLYNHFKSKREIFQAIVDICWHKAKEYYHSRGLPFSEEDDLSIFHQRGQALEETVSEIFRYFFQDPWNSRFRQLLCISQFEDRQAQELYCKLYCQYPVQVQTAIFASLLGPDSDLDPQTLALQFHGAAFLLLNSCQDWEQARPSLLRAVRDIQGRIWAHKNTDGQ